MLIGLVGPFVFYFGGIGYYNVMSAKMEGYDVFSQTLGNMWFWLAVPLISALSVLPTWLYFFISARYFPSVRRCPMLALVTTRPCLLISLAHISHRVGGTLRALL